jgi:ABC-type transport system substrate-binding protein
LFNRDLAAAKFGEYLKQNGAKNLNLMLPADDLRARLACERIKKQIEEVAKGEGGAITITLLPTPPGEFFRKVQEEHGYDLAYWNFDYPDDWFPFGLGAALDPTAANRNGRNLFGYLVADPTVVPSEADRQLGKTLAEARLHGDPARLTALAADIHMQFNEAMPFVPLWQLDRHIVVSSALKPILDDAPRPLPARNLDPARLFSNVSKWRVE